jgi:hypothetical protein
MHTSLRALIVIAFAAFSATGCGGGSSSSPAAAAPPPPDTALNWDQENWDQRNWQ